MVHLSAPYIDDSYPQEDTCEQCVQEVIDTVTIFNNLGLTIHPEKSIFTLTQRLIFLGFSLDSQSMIISLTLEKARKVKNSYQHISEYATPSIREEFQKAITAIDLKPDIDHDLFAFRINHS